MDPKISKELKNATEKLQTKMLAMQQAEADMLALKTAFVNATDPAKKEKLKPALIAMAKKLKAAEAEADHADAMFHKVLSSEPGDIYDLLDHKIQEHIIRTTIRKIVKESLKKINSTKINEAAEEPVSLHNDISKWFNSNKKKLEKLADEDSWDEFYDLGFEKFPDVDQDDVAQAMNRCAMEMDWFAAEETEMPTEKELEAKSFGDKSQQKGIQMADYNKKMKSPKTSSTELYIESKKKKK